MNTEDKMTMMTMYKMMRDSPAMLECDQIKIGKFYGIEPISYIEIKVSDI